MIDTKKILNNLNCLDCIVTEIETKSKNQITESNLKELCLCKSEVIKNVTELVEETESFLDNFERSSYGTY